jgi:glycosyltransferase involved in cell wall biosynthesis
MLFEPQPLRITPRMALQARPPCTIPRLVGRARATLPRIKPALDGPVRLALLVAGAVYTHTPVYRRVAADPRLDFTAIFASNAGIRSTDVGFGHPVSWDVDLLEGYRSVFLRRADKNPINATSPLALRDLDVVPRLLRGRYEVLWLLGYNYVTHTLAAVTQRARGGALVFHEEQTLLHDRGALTTVAKSLILPILFGQGSALYIGTRNRDWFSHYGVPAERLFFTPYTVDNDGLQQERRRLTESKSELRAEFQIAPDAGPVVVSTMRLVPKKQPLFLLEAFKRARQQARCVLLIAGSGPLEGEMRGFVRDEGIPDVHFAGFLNRSEVCRAYACADLFTLASLEHETWGLVVNEAMNFGLPILVSDKVGSGIDLVEEGANGYVASAYDPEAFAARMLTLVRDEDLRKAMGAASLARIADWNPDVTAKGIADAVAERVGPRRWERAERWAAEQREVAAVKPASRTGHP